MNNLFFRGIIAVFFLFALMASPSKAEVKGPKVTGTWDYSAPQAPYEYSKGKIILTENNDKLEGKVSIDGNEMKLNNIKLENG